MNMDLTRRSLFSADSEESVIGSLLLGADVFEDVVEAGLTAKSFYDLRHAAIYSTISAMYESNQPVDVVTVAENLEASGSLKQIGGLAFLGELADRTPSIKNAGAYAKILRTLEFERLWFQSAQDIESVLTGTECEDHADRMGRIQMILERAEKTERENSVIELRPALKNYLEVIDERANNPGIHGVLTGFEFVDHRLMGMKGGDFGVIGGRPSMGKTAYSMNIVKHVALKQKLNAMVFSLEMSTDQLVQRMVAAEGQGKAWVIEKRKGNDS